MDLDKLHEFIKSIAKSGISEVEIETKDLKLSIKTPTKGKSSVHTTQETTPIIQTVPIAQPITTAIPQPVATPATTPPPATSVVPESGSTEDKKKTELDNSKYKVIKAPMVGTFYRKPGPDKPVFVNVGDEIAPGKVLCIIEAMKLFNEIESEISGKIVKILVEDATPVEFDQPLFLVEPS